MYLLASGDEIQPLLHVVDRTLVEIGGTPILTMHMITLVLAALLCLPVMLIAASAIATGKAHEGNRRFVARGRLGQIVEVIILGLRDTMLRPLLGKEAADRYMPYLLTLFFFILMNNMIGLVPLLDLQGILGVILHLGPITADPQVHNEGAHWAVVGGTATGNLGINAGLALIAFLVIQAHGIKENGVGGWAHHLLGGAPVWLFPIMVPVELMGMIIKPCALTIRLFANMFAGHTLMAILMLFGVIAYGQMHSMLGALGISVVSGLFALAIYFLELFVAFLQAFVFMFLTAVFISQLSHHGDHHPEHEEHLEAAAA